MAQLNKSLRGGNDTWHQPLKTYFREALQKERIAGGSLVLLHGNRILDSEFYGLANVEQNRPVDENTIYHWASITKTFTGIAIMQLRDRGRLKLDDPVVSYLPELRKVHDPYGALDTITIRHLLTHTAGFRAATWPWKDKPWHPHEPLKWEQLVAMFAYTELEFKPGSEFRYSNLGIVFLGRIIELVTTDDYEVYIDKNVFKPLEMYRSYFDTTPYHLRRFKAQSYYLKDGKLNPADPDVNTGITVANGGLNAPLGDIAKYLVFLIGDPPKQAIYDEILKPSSLQEMFRQQVEVSKQPKVGLGLAFFLEDHGGVRFICHSGGQNAFISRFCINKTSRAGYVVAFNTLVEDSPNPRTGTRALEANLRDYVFKNVPVFGLSRTRE